MKYLRLLIVVWLLGACAASQSVLDDSNANLDIFPQDINAINSLEPETELIWGGLIIGTSNLKSHTQIEVLAYPLSRRLRPDTSLNPVGRFLIKHTGYLETMDYSPGRLISVAGEVEKLQRQSIGDTIQEFPVLVDRQLHLWKSSPESSESRVNFGFGFMISN